MPGQLKVVVCASGGGGNFQALIDARVQLGMEISMLLVDRHCGAIARAQRHGIAWRQIDVAADKGSLDATFDAAMPPGTQLIVLAGFLPIVPSAFCSRWAGRIINIHPSLLPKHGGKGMYGVRVQEAVLAAGDTSAGCTVHHVSSVVAGGAIILQQVVNVAAGETAWQLGGRIFKEEGALLVNAIATLRQSLVRSTKL